MANNRGTNEEPEREATGSIRLLFPSNYITAADLTDREGKPRDVTITIARVVYKKVTMEGGKSEEKKVVRMSRPDGSDVPKGWILNKTNAKTIEALLGSDKVETWKGRKVTLYPTTCKGAQGGIVACIRVRSRVDTGQRAAEIPDGVAAMPSDANAEGGAS